MYKTEIQKMAEKIKEMVVFPKQIETKLAEAFKNFSAQSNQNSIVLDFLKKEYGIELEGSDKNTFLSIKSQDELKQLLSLTDSRANDIVDYGLKAYHDAIANELAVQTPAVEQIN